MEKEQAVLKICLVDDTTEYATLLKKKLEDAKNIYQYYAQLVESWKEDDFDVRFLKQHDLDEFQKLKLEVFHFEKPEDFLSYCDIEVPDVVVIDYHMPRMTGLELFKSLSSKFEKMKQDNPSFQAPKRILLSSNDDGNLVLEMAKNGVEFYVEKGPHEMPGLLSIMATGYFYEPI